MTIEQAVSSAEFILIEGDRGAGKNMLSTFFASTSGNERTVAIVAIPAETYYKKHDICTKMMQEQKFDFTNVFLLGEDWKNTKKQYGLDFIIRDIERVLDATGAQFLYIQRIDLLFDMMDPLGSFEVLSNIARLVLSRKVKTVVTLLKPSDNYTSIHDALLNYADLTLAIAHDNGHKGRQVQVISSFYPLEHSVYQFVYGEGRFSLSEKRNIQEPQSDPVPVAVSPNPIKTPPETVMKMPQKENINIVVVAQGGALSRWSNYLFGNLARVSLRRFRELSELNPELWEQSDVVVFESDTMESIYAFFAEANEHVHGIKAVGVLSNGFVRAEDKVRAHQLNAAELFGKNMRILDYVLGLEKSIGVSFYSETIQKKLESVTVDSSGNFIDLIEASLNLRRIFTIYVFGYVRAFGDERLETVFRGEDIAYLDEENHKLYLLFFNAQGSDYEVMLKKLLTVKEDVFYEKAIEAPDLFNGREALFEHSFKGER